MALIKCKECGQMISDIATNCPNCGAPRLPNYRPIEQQDKTGPWKPLFIVVAIVPVLVMVIIGLNTCHNTKYTAANEAPASAAVLETKSFETVKDVRKNIEGTIWTYTKIIDDDDNYGQWCRLEFRDGKLHFCEVSPSHGNWGEPSVCDYEIDERRYSNTGERFIGIRWHSNFMNYSFVPATKALYWQSRSGYKLGAELSEGDCFPWD